MYALSNAHAEKELDNKNINKGVLCFQIPHKEKSVLRVNSDGYDRDTHIEPQLFLLRTF